MPTKRPATPKAASYDIDFVRSAASSRWPEILSQVCGVDIDTLDGQHHPCPKCGGDNRFRYFKDSTGGAICNQCFRAKNGDGFAFVQWMKGFDFAGALQLIADYLGVEPESRSSGKSGGKGGKSKPKKSSQVAPDEKLKFLPWSDALVAVLWCPTKPPVTIAALKRCHARLAQYGSHQVIALPVWGEQLTAADPVGWAVYNINGQPLPTYTYNDKTNEYKLKELVKVKLTFGSQPGIIGPVELIREQSITHLWKLEGPSDVLAWYSLPGDDLVATGHLAITNANGCGEKPQQWMIDLCQRKQSIVLHDADQPGQHGAIGYDDKAGEHHPGWCEYLNGATA